jgi:transcriptional regulator with XRE-family HTH domain
MVKQSFSEILREALRNTPQTRYRISQETGISESHLSRFVHGTRWLSEANLNLLIDYLGIQVSAPKNRKGK